MGHESDQPSVPSVPPTETDPLTGSVTRIRPARVAELIRELTPPQLIWELAQVLRTDDPPDPELADALEDALLEAAPEAIWEHAQEMRRQMNLDGAADLETALLLTGYEPPERPLSRDPIDAGWDDLEPDPPTPRVPRR